MTYRTLCYTVGNQALSAQPLPREAEDIPRGGKDSKDALLDYMLR